MRAYPRAVLGVVLAGVLTSCGGGGGDADPTSGAPGPVITSVSVTSPSAVLAIGQMVQLVANAKDQNGNAIAATSTWSSSAAGVASVTTSSGLVTAVGAGSATITASATANGRTVSGSIQLTVSGPQAAPALTSVTISSPGTSVLPGGTLQLTATPRDQNGSPIAATLSWSTSASAIATVNQSGLVGGVAQGTATISVTATSGSTTVSHSVNVTVTSATPVLTSVLITPSGGTLALGTTLQLSASPRDQFGNAIAGTVSWSSSANAIASVNASGLVTAGVPGNATITAMATSGSVTVAGDVLVTVAAPFPSTEMVSVIDFAFSPATVEIARNGTVAWTFGGINSHTVTFSAGSGAPADISATSSGTFERQFSSAGTFTYMCSIHPQMTGTVIVH